MKLVCLVVEPVVVVAEDLALTIQDLAPVAPVSSFEEAATAVEQLASVDLVCLGVAPQRVAATDLRSTLDRAEARLVYLGYEADARELGARYVEQPFTTEAIAEQLLSLPARMSSASPRDCAG